MGGRGAQRISRCWKQGRGGCLSALVDPVAPTPAEFLAFPRRIGAWLLSERAGSNTGCGSFLLLPALFCVLYGCGWEIGWIRSCSRTTFSTLPPELFPSNRNLLSSEDWETTAQYFNNHFITSSPPAIWKPPPPVTFHLDIPSLLPLLPPCHWMLKTDWEFVNDASPIKLESPAGTWRRFAR